MVAFGVHVGTEGCSVDELRAAWARIEGMGFDWISLWDHFSPMLYPAGAPAYEAVACHAALACSTSTVRIGSGVYSVGFRHPALLARSAVTIDHLSGGRLELGLGAGWHREEYDAFGFEFEAGPVRLRRLKEYAEVIRLLWQEEVVDYAGEFYQLRGARCDPKPVQPHARLWLGAPGEKIGIKIAAAIADGWNCSGLSAVDFRRKRSILMDAAPNPESMLTAAQVSFMVSDHDSPGLLAQRFGPRAEERVGGADGILHGSVQQVIDMAAEYVDAGADRMILRLQPPFDFEELERVATEVVPHFTR